MRSLANFSHSFQISIVPHKKLYIRPLIEADLDECVHIVTDSFIKNGSPSKLLNISYENFSKFARAGFQRSIDDQLAFICKDSSQSKVIGTAVFWDQFKRINNPIYYGSPLTSQADNSLQEMMNSVMSQKKLIPSKPNEIIYFSYLKTDNEYSTYKISKELMNFFVQEHPIGSKASLIYRESIMTPSKKNLLTKLGWKQFATLNLQKYIPKDHENYSKSTEDIFKELGIVNPKTISMMGFRPNE